jgi:hypothetical protein
MQSHKRVDGRSLIRTHFIDKVYVMDVEYRAKKKYVMVHKVLFT